MDRSSTDDESATMPSEVYIVLHERQMSVDARYSNYAQPYCQQMNSEIISVHYEYENAVSHASKYVREFWAMDDEDEEWLEQLDWQGEGWYDEKAQQTMQEMHRVHVLAMQIY